MEFPDTIISKVRGGGAAQKAVAAIIPPPEPGRSHPPPRRGAARDVAAPTAVPLHPTAADGAQRDIVVWTAEASFVVAAIDVKTTVVDPNQDPYYQRQDSRGNLRGCGNRLEENGCSSEPGPLLPGPNTPGHRLVQRATPSTWEETVPARKLDFN